MTTLWQLHIHCPLAEADALSDTLAEQALGVTIDVDGDTAIVTGIFAAPLDDAATTGLAGRYKHHWQPLVQRDWLVAGARAAGAGRVGAFNLVDAPATATRLVSNRSLYLESFHAFGDGYHATTQGCLQALEYIGHRACVQRMADIGTGTGVLALAARKLWPRARIVASDIDPTAVAVTRRNRMHNAGRRIQVAVGAGLTPRLIGRHAPYDVIAANILARPLCRIAAAVRKQLKHGGYVVLSGLLDAQTPLIVKAYAAQRLHVCWRRTDNGWTTLVLR